MTGYTNIGGMSAAQALINGTADATAAAADIAKGKTAYANWKKITGTAPVVKSTTVTFNQGVNYEKSYRSDWADTMVYKIYPYEYQGNNDNIQSIANVTPRWFCKQIPYSGQVLGYKVNGVYYPLFNIRPTGFSVILKGEFSAKLKYLIHEINGEEIAMMIDPGNAKVQIGASSYYSNLAWTPPKKYTVEVFYMTNP